MVYKCSAFGCKSGYDSQAADENVMFHAFPVKPDIREKWIQANPQQDFIPTKNSRLCQ